MLMYTNYLDSGFGLIEVTADDEGINSVAFVEKMDITKAVKGGNEVTEAAVTQLREYFMGERKSFDLKINQDGTDFQKQVWQVLPNVPYGETITYSEIAEKLGNSKAVRAVSSAIAKNNLAIIVPCHRVVSKDGSANSYAWGSERKKALLSFEKRNA
jgi:methylated-DNA-[protein]-cysteine S-methyltransferase